MAVVVSGISLPFEEENATALRKAADLCGLSLSAGVSAAVCREAVDARRGELKRVVSVRLDGLSRSAEARLCERLADRVRPASDTTLDELIARAAPPDASDRPVVVGLGPAGMFAALTLARMGLRPIVLERGRPVARRDGDVARFVRERALDPESNVQFGEGGAGAYSDGKLTTRIHDPLCSAVLAELAAHGAPREILTRAHPHVGTDLLKGVVAAIDRETEALGGEIRFETALTGIRVKNGRLTALCTAAGEIPCSRAIFAPGHSARDTFASLLAGGIELIPKSFAAGVRVEHRQSDIDRDQYGRYAGTPGLGAAEYFVSRREGGRGCFSFCMCPGGTVCAAASEAGGVVTNGMSLHARDGENGNAAIAVSADVSLFPPGPLGGIELARRLEEAAFDLGGRDYTAPAQRVGDFLAGRPSAALGRVRPTYPLGVRPGSVESLLPPGGAALMRRALADFARRLPFFGDPDAVLTGPETRTSSPVRMTRGENGESLTVRGVFPCGEGAGYAGGIMSAAVDGVRQALKLAEKRD